MGVLFLLYNLLLFAAAPAVYLRLALTSRHRVLLNRFHPSLDATAPNPIWIHAVSVGEVQGARALIDAFRKRRPDAPILLTASTVAGFESAQQVGNAVHAAWCPFDLLPVVRRFLDGAAPHALVLMETELWPNLLNETARRGIPIVLVNGRLSDKHFPRYYRFRFVAKRLLNAISAAGMQNAEYANRIVQLGLAPDRVEVTGSMKFDVADAGDNTAISAERMVAMGFRPGEPVLLFASTRPGDEALALSTWKSLRERYPDLRLVLAPRHPDRMQEIEALLDAPYVKRSQFGDESTNEDEPIFILDTLGELRDFLPAATIAVIGGSFFPGVNGHNPVESAALGVPTVFGPYMRNFVDAAEALLAEEGAVQVESASSLEPVLCELLADVEKRDNLGKRAQSCIQKHKGAVLRNVELIESVLETRSTA